MSSVILLEKLDPPTGCKECPFLNDDINCCELLSKAANKAVLVNKYATARDKRCPIYYIDDYHGRLIDEKDIRELFATMPFSMKEIKYSMSDIFNNIAVVAEVAPRYKTKSENFRDARINFNESLRRLVTLSDITEEERQIENLLPKGDVNDGR